MGHSLAALTMISRLIRTSREWSEVGLPAEAIGVPLRIAMADRWLGGWPRDEWRRRLDGFDSPAFRGLRNNGSSQHSPDGRRSTASAWSQSAPRQGLTSSAISASCELTSFTIAMRLPRVEMLIGASS